MKYRMTKKNFFLDKKKKKIGPRPLGSVLVVKEIDGKGKQTTLNTKMCLGRGKPEHWV